MAVVCSPLSLEEAVKDKYCDVGGEGASVPPAHTPVREVAISYRPDACPVQRRSSIVLDRHGITHVDSAAELESLCPQVEELNLAANAISHWRDVCGIIASLPKLSFLDLSQNPLEPDMNGSPLSPSLSPSLSVLVLNITCVSWDAVQTCLDLLPGLLELHLSRNGYTSVDLDPSFRHESLHKLHINDNEFNDWSEIEKLSPAFPALTTLVATSNPLSVIPPLRDCVFPKLSQLNLNSTTLSEWSSIDNLAVLGALLELCVLKVPVGKQYDEKKRRYSTIARLPHLKKLNKSDVSTSEREDAERWFVRLYATDHDAPPSYAALVEKHGRLQPLVEVDFSASEEASIEFQFDDKRSEIHKISLHQTTAQLRKWLSHLIKRPANSFRLIYVDSTDLHMTYGSVDPSIMHMNSKYLYAYAMKDGDRIKVQLLG